MDKGRWESMRWMNVLLGLIVLVVGLFPFFEDSIAGLSSISSGPVYNGIVVALGVVILIFNLKSDERKINLR